MASGQLRIIKVIGVTDDKDIKKMANSLDSVTKSAKKLETGFSSLKNLAYGAAGASIFGFGARELSGIADGMIQLNSKLTIFVGEGEKASRAFKDIAQIANDTKAPINDIATIFTRIAVATQRLNLSTDTQLKLTRLLQQSFRVSGATAEESTASTIQFAQALSFGQLRGQELRSVLSQNAVLANIFGKAIEGSGKDIYKFAEAGGFTTKFVLKALFDNMQDIEDMAQKLAPTFEQTLTLAMNKFTIAVKDLNTEFDLNGKFARGMQWLLDNGNEVAGVILAIASTAIPRLILSVQSLTVTMLANPLGIIVTAAGALIGGLTLLAVKLAGGFKEFMAEIKALPQAIALVALQFTQLVFAVGTLGMTSKEGFLDSTVERMKWSIEAIRQGAKDFEKEMTVFDELKIRSEKATVETPIADPVLSIEKQIGALNARFNAGRMGAASFIKELERLEKLQLKEKLLAGTTSLAKFHEELGKNKVEYFALQMEYGLITIDQFNKKINEFKIQELSRKFAEAKVTLEQYTEQMRKLKIEGMDQESIMTGIAKGTDAYLSSVKSMSEQVGTIVEGAFKGMEDALFNMTKTGALNFKDMAQSILDDITRMAIRMAILKPIAGMMGNMFDFGAPSTGAAISGSASGATMGGGFGADLKLAKGGVLDGPSFFGMGQGKTGVAGEAGPEAVLPLKRSADGVLGVRAAPTTINIINNGNSEVTTQEKTGPDGSKVIDVMIQAKVREGITNGMFDKQMRQSYGISRKGV